MLSVSGVCSIGRRQKNLLLKTLLEGFHFCHFETLWAPLRKPRICGKITALITLARISLTSFTNLVSLVLVMVVWDQGVDGGGGVGEIHLGNFSLKAQGVTFHGLRRYKVLGCPLGPFQPSPPPYFPPNSPWKGLTWGMGGRIAGLAVLIWRSRDRLHQLTSQSFPPLNLPHTQRYLPSPALLTNAFTIAKGWPGLGYFSNDDWQIILEEEEVAWRWSRDTIWVQRAVSWQLPVSCIQCKVTMIIMVIMIYTITVTIWTRFSQSQNEKEKLEMLLCNQLHHNKISLYIYAFSSLSFDIS